jgi:glutaredoxin-related protein
MYRIFVITGLCALAIIVTAGQLDRYLHDYKAVDGQSQKTQYAQQRAQHDFPNAERQQQSRHCSHCALSLADLSLSDATFDGVTITNHSKNTLEEITFEVTMKDCPPGHNPANSADQCVIVGQESKGVEVFIPPGQARGFHSKMNFHDVPLPPRSRRFFLWRVVSAKGMGAP